MKFKITQFIVPNFWKKMSFMLPAVLLMGVFVSILLEIGWGTDPASFMNQNIASVLNWSLGNTQVLVYGLMFLFVLFFGTQYIGFGTLANMFLIGYTIDFCKWIWLNTGFHNFILNGNLTQNLIIFCITLLLFVVCAAIYINSQMGVAPYDASPQIISNWITRIPFFVIRIIFDLSAVGIGVLFGLFNTNGIQGSAIGSIAMSLLLGPIITIVGKPLKKILD